MLDVTKLLISEVFGRAEAHHAELYGGGRAAPLALVEEAVSSAFGLISTSDALYHNLEHTAHVTLVGLEILRNKHLAEDSVPATTWANVVVALLCHDIGYVRALCRGDTAQALVTGVEGQPLQHVGGSSDAVLMPVHVNRGKRFVEERFLKCRIAEVGFINACIERTRFPVPDDPWYRPTADFPGLVRAADLIGQLSDPRYLNKLSAIFYEFEETGFNDRTGYERPGDLLTGYPAFFDSAVAPYIAEAVGFLKQSEEGKDVLAHLYENLDTARRAHQLPLADAANS
ncbi:MAG: metal-dependent phosphohydrolase [Gammaproteobacteria bacterium]